MLSSKFPLLVATDLSPTGKVVLEKAFKLAKRYHKPLFILHVSETTLFAPKIIELTQIEANLCKLLEPFYARYPEVKATLLCRQGGIEESIISAIKETQASLLLIGTSGEDNLLREFFLGSHCRKIIRFSTIPVLVVKNEEESDYSKIFIPTDFSPSSQKMANLTLHLFPHAYISLFHVILKPFEQRLGMYGLDKDEILRYHKDIDNQSASEADHFIEKLKLPSGKHRIKLLMETGVFSAKLCLQKVKEAQSDLIALNTTGNISFFSMDILNQSPKDVLIFKTDSE